MTNSRPPSPLHASDYEAIYEAMMETSRGRWFLNEFADRNRSADTGMLLEAIAKLESGINHPQTAPGTDTVFKGLLEMSNAIQKTREEIASIKLPHEQNSQILSATEELDSIVRATEIATNDILQAAENIQEMAWTLRESGVDNDTCDDLDGRATDIYTACSFQDITGQRTQKVVHVLRYLEASLHSMIEIGSLMKQPGQARRRPLRPNGPAPRNSIRRTTRRAICSKGRSTMFSPKAILRAFCKRPHSRTIPLATQVRRSMQHLWRISP